MLLTLLYHLLVAGLLTDHVLDLLLQFLLVGDNLLRLSELNKRLQLVLEMLIEVNWGLPSWW